MESIADTISKLNEHGICTKGSMTFGCACENCYQEIINKIKELFK